MLENKNILIMGMGVTGKSALRFLSNYPCKVYVYDENLETGKNIKEDFVIFKEEDLDKIDLIIKSPGIYPFHDILKKARELGIEIISDIELSYRFLNSKNIIAITGTNGKTTTTTVVKNILSRVRKTYDVGNIGNGILDITREVKDGDCVVIEASSFQLEDTKEFKPHIALLTYVTSDHLDWHGSVENYVNAKFKIFANQDENDFAILNYKDKDMEQAKNIKADKYFFSIEPFDGKGTYVKDNAIFFSDGNVTEKVIDVSDIKIPGEHNIKNIMGAIIISKLLGVDNEIIAEAIKSFSGVEHRIEYVSEVKNVKFYNDSKGTNPDSTEVAIKAMDGNVILIAGGYDKGASFDTMIKNTKDKLKVLILFGQTAPKISEVCKKENIDFYIVKDLNKAVELSYNLSEDGDDVLFSPACASWDMYHDYEERGRHFKNIVKELI
ncbi:UDP-N-acetylmuramoyl-L-alanine--D-glutamate ligase [Peptoniphilus sp.]|jgi:UDP-N-acetylmuramoylalanine--D-glutamate ligase|uniref:UDP-N-acetylmuramoyl-L-alanine--D-glutamate ligase n=1 Tax=Peptoniphilus sp. TaxID=1971214 RepID=UPI003D936B42